MNPQVLAGIQSIATTPLAQGLVRYWWLSLPLGYLGWHYAQKRRSEGKLNLPEIVNDLAPAVGIVVGLILLNETLSRNAPSRPTSSPLQAQAKDATFTPQVPNAQALPTAE